MSYNSPSSSQGQFAYNPASPPLPPPKPSAHSSGTATPLAGPPRPPPAGQSPGGEEYQQHGQYQPGQSVTYIQYAPDVEPPPEGWLPDIVKDKSTIDLQSLLSDTALQQALLHDPKTSHPSIAASTEPLKSLLESNIALASNLKVLEAQIQSQRAATQQRLLSLRALERQFRAKQAEQETALRDFSAPALYQKLVSAIAEQESLCRGLEESFLEDESGKANEREIEVFVKRLKEARKIAYLRQERKERWDEGRVGGWR
ncbi:uncharacterized protein PV09_07337 [Verruconis gallopava]|uniref:VPS37 C-terminal domain-containing protein n=1 Tax=Verruconis gallopava TaxID=253628 RepID=A0A0D2AQ64_9PEZI|nr:uncharacterized protein PV09_07337 [Verruconis gallopava]KIW01299.1 hypothetical protein PV09_07337 [Verruconis gallopava]